MTARLVVSWPVHDDTSTLRDLERIARSEWAGHVAEAGIWATTDPVFEIGQNGDELVLVGQADAILGPIEPRSWRQT